jgi:hypothetical protein
VISGFGGVQHMQSASRVAVPVHSPQQRQLAGSGLTLQREPFPPAVGRIHLIAPTPPQPAGAGQAGQEPARLRPCPQGLLAGRFDQLHLRDADGQPPLAVPANGPAVHPRPGPRGQLGIDGTKMAGG